ncbi:MAG TPA: mechanosensitive ion channel domain-containing protein, partial [Gemmataceae bacterium]|nr:mechanosensitive ion channel domain-containing protein [Gemmataceae bacterium]
MNELWQKAQEALPKYLGDAAGVLIILAVGGAAMRYLVGPLRRLLGRSRVDPSAASFLTNSARAVILIVVVIAVLQQLGVQTTSLLAVLGTAGVAVALSLQNSLANFAAGLLVLAFRIVRVGDQVEIGDVRGRVAEMLPFHVVLVGADNQRITVPNSLLANGTVRNHSALPPRRAQWSFPVKPQDDLARVKEALLARLRAEGRVLADPPPAAYVKEWDLEKRVVAAEAWAAAADWEAVQQNLLEPLGQAVEA